MRRTPVVANQFYPGDPSILSQTLSGLIPGTAEKQSAIAAISPHAGYIYSGSVAGETFSRIIIPEDVIILGPNHHGNGASIGLMAHGSWDMPLGEVPINEELAQLILTYSTLVEEDEVCHRNEHSLEVQVPFLQYQQKKLTIAPLVISHISYAFCEEIGKTLATAIKKYDKPVLIVASTDMTHYESRQSASHKDQQAIRHILELDPQGLYDTVLGQRISMCGIMPTTITLIAALELGATRAELVRYTDSGEVSGDVNQVVGYAGITIHG